MTQPDPDANPAGGAAPTGFAKSTETVLVVDQVTSTGRIIDLGVEAAHSERVRLNSLIDRSVARHGGVVDFACGDGAIARFRDTDAAHAATVDLHGTVGSVSSPSAPAPARLRAALHVDELLIDDDGRPFGLGLVIAVRSCAFARPGGTVVSNRAKARLDPRQRARVEWLGPVQLKGIPWKVCLWAAGAAVPSEPGDRASKESGRSAHILRMPVRI